MTFGDDAQRPVILWFRQDLRLADNLAVAAAAASDLPVIPVFILHEAADGRPWGAASRWWLDKSLAALAKAIEARGSRLILRQGDPAVIIPRLVAETGANGVVWNRLYGSHAVARDTALKIALERSGVTARSFNGGLLVEPWTLSNGSGGAYRVFTPFWRAARAEIGRIDPKSAPARLRSPAQWPHGDALASFGLHPRSPDWSGGFGDWLPGEVGARARLDEFIDDALSDYREARDRPDKPGSSRLSPHLHWGEIGPRQVWAAAQASAASGLASEGEVEKFLAELGWREFNHHLLFSHSHLYRRNVRPQFDGMAWLDDPEGLAAWREGRTGYPLVDAGMRELWATGFMHNRVRMVVASFLIKHLLIDWRQGEAWFWDTLVDACAANNPANWQWTAGSGADAAPFFRIFNPTLQGERFDPNGDYVRQWAPELAHLPAPLIHRPAGPDRPAAYPRPIVEHDFARARALKAFAEMRQGPSASPVRVETY
jgi:deoxyribodipyrimidine photo-lyase